MPAAVELQGLTRHFGAVKAVTDVTFGFDRGTIFGFIGPNGAGKTTTMRILATLDVPSSGEAWIAGHSVIDYPDRVRRRIGYLPDYYGTYVTTSVEDYLEFFARAYGLRGRALRQTVEQVIDFTGMTGIREKLVDTLSKGMKQRLALGRTLLNDPDVLIMDEPAAGLDPRARIEFRELAKLLAEQGKAILISSHILTELSEMVDACAIIERGKILAQGTVEEVRQIARTRIGVRAEIKVELLAPDPAAERILREQPFVLEVRGDGKDFTLQFDGDRKAAAALLKTLIERGLVLVSFRASEADLEDVFMAVTKGELQ